MTPNTPSPNLAQSLILIHKVITRGLYTSLIKGREYLQSGLPEGEQLKGYSSYVGCFTQVLDVHHRVEDLIMFPAFIKVIPSAPYAQLSADHHAVETLLAVMPGEISGLSGKTANESLKKIYEILEKLSGVWESHMLLEEHFFSVDALGAGINLEEQIRIGEATSNYSRENSKPAELIIPFLLYNLEPKDRASMATSYPPEITQELVPTIWKDQWVPMKPFLLN